MKKIAIMLLLIISFLIVGCSSNIQPILQGTYQSDFDKDGYIVQFAIQTDDNSFVEYIDNREVDRGTYEQKQANVYKLKSDKQNFEITLNNKNAFEIIINQLNNGNPIQLINIDDTPTYSSTDFDDVEAYKDLLN
ncbi:hypothetical protein [Virgibacillus sp. LDC-1]|uniref:hypothetical protein n=1 Tax=Virgibacillus sp. LDC-1 TaxID=3039856 RepID=UPI0024DE4A51|nr:hypothetical protein [Virgibacillus sp. LDC-1]